ncbi:slc38a11 [Symbiodinium necroappetens]|uniref:Slc38a11 protein n=1 Tax=Symbiodinium necroappetens TaxID=1628268 RepID=A0A812U7D9_9DINO|nr:slc38a11 [Symbiodinium necroappetens]
MVGYSCITCKAKTFRELWNKLLSANTAWLIDVIIFLNGWITLVCYIILIGDFMSKSFLGLLGPDHLLTKSRVLNQTVITAMVLLPLSLARDLHVLAYTSILGLGVLVYVVILVIHDSWMNSTSISHDTPLCEWNMGIFEAISLYTNAFVAHYNAPKVFAELANPTYERWTLLVAIAYGIAFAVYAENYGPYVHVLIAWLGMGFSIAFTYPLVFNSAREAATHLLSMAREQLQATSCGSALCEAFSSRVQHLQAAWNSGWRRSPRSPPAKKRPHQPGTKTTVALVFLTYIIAIRCEDVGVANALAGSVMGCLICFFLPGLLFFLTVSVQLRSRVGLPQPLLGKGAPKPGPALYWKLRLAQAAGAVTAFSGVLFTIIGTERTPESQLSWDSSPVSPLDMLASSLSATISPYAVPQGGFLLFASSSARGMPGGLMLRRITFYNTMLGSQQVEEQYLNSRYQREKKPPPQQLALSLRPKRFGDEEAGHLAKTPATDGVASICAARGPPSP